MKRKLKDYSQYDIPDIEETEFALGVSPCPRIEDPNDLGDMGDSFSIGLDVTDEFLTSDS
jgi:hypothetical protein